MIAEIILEYLFGFSGELSDLETKQGVPKVFFGIKSLHVTVLKVGLHNIYFLFFQLH